MLEKYTKIFLRGIGQVFLQNNAWTGLLFLLGIFYNSAVLGMGALLGSIISTLSAKIFKYNNEEIENGLYGFNGVLVGVAILFFFKTNIITISLVVVGSIFSTILMHYLKEKIPAYTSPFVISTWIVIYLLLIFIPNYFINSTGNMDSSINIFKTTTKGFGEVMFQDNIITGVFFAIGILINSLKDFGYALYGSILSTIISFIFLLPPTMTNLGLIGYNSILTSIALSGKKKSFYLATIGIILSVIVLLIFNKINIIALTAPFVISTWMVLFLSKKLKIGRTNIGR